MHDLGQQMSATHEGESVSSSRKEMVHKLLRERRLNRSGAGTDLSNQS